VTTTLLAVDDSKTMRRVIEITFAGEPEYRLVLADSADEAIARLRSERPSLVLADVTLGEQNGYDLCQRIKREAPATIVVVLSSKQQPFDRNRGAAVGADDFLDKPFDTQALIDKVGTLIRRGPQVAAAPPSVRAAPVQPVAVAHPPPGGIGARPVQARAQTLSYGVPASQSAPPAATPPARAATLPGTPVPGQARPVPVAPVAATPPSPPHPPAAPRAAPAAAPAPPAVAAARPVAPPVAAPPPPAAVAAAAAAAAAAPGGNGQLAGRLQALGLTPDQVNAVLALSREVVEQVVWEVVPVLAETIIKEEIRRLTSD
jgi:CheY-like chemotaxis protein